MSEPELQNRLECWFQAHTDMSSSSETVGTPAVSLMALNIYYSGPFFQTFQDPVFEAIYQFSSFQSLRHLQLFVTPWTAARQLLCPSPTPRACSNSGPSSRWCHPTISSSVILFFCLQSFPASGSFPMSRLFASGGQSLGVSALASVLSMNIQDWFSLGLTGLISLLSKGLSRIFSSTTVQISFEH